jgi:hypothetical protein
VTLLLKCCPLRGNGLINKRSITRQQLATTSVTVEALLETVFSMWSMLKLYRDHGSQKHKSKRISTVGNRLVKIVTEQWLVKAITVRQHVL